MVRFIISIAIALATLTSAPQARGESADVAPEGRTVPQLFRLAVLPRADGPAAGADGLDVFSDNGLVVEFELDCGQTSGLFTYSRSEQLYCDPQFRCSTSKEAAMAALCGR